MVSQMSDAARSLVTAACQVQSSDVPRPKAKAPCPEDFAEVPPWRAQPDVEVEEEEEYCTPWIRAEEEEVQAEAELSAIGFPPPAGEEEEEERVDGALPLFRRMKFRHWREPTERSIALEERYAQGNWDETVGKPKYSQEALDHTSALLRALWFNLPRDRVTQNIKTARNCEVFAGRYGVVLAGRLWEMGCGLCVSRSLCLSLSLSLSLSIPLSLGLSFSRSQGASRREPTQHHDVSSHPNTDQPHRP